MTKFIVKTVEIVFIGLLAIILLAMSVSLIELFFNGVIAFILGITLLTGIIGGLFLLRKSIQRLYTFINKRLSYLSFFQMALILFFISVITKVFFVFLLDNNADLHPDMAMYRSYAIQFANQGKITENTGYALKHNYTMIYGLILSPLVKLFGDNTKVFTTALSVMNSISLVLILDILKKYINPRVAFYTLMIYCLLPFGVFQTQLLIHENGLFFFHIFALWLFLNVFNEKNPLWIKIICLLSSAFVIALGKSINASGRVVFVSFFIFAVAKVFTPKINIKKIIRLLSISLALIIFYSGSSSVVKKITKYTVEGAETYVGDSLKLPYGWSLYVGFNYETQGGMTLEDGEIYHKYMDMETKDEALKYQKNLISERLKEYDAIKLISHFFNKIKKLFGTQLLPFAYDQGNEISFWISRGIVGKLFRLINAFSFLILYVIIFISKIKNFKKNDYSKTLPHIHCQMVIIGVTLALLLFEVTPKYASHLHILFFFILAMSVKGFFDQKCHSEKSENDEKNIETSEKSNQTAESF